MSKTRCDFLYLSEEDMIKAGVTDMPGCIDAMGEVISLLNKGDYVMSGSNHNSHGAMISFPDEPEFPNMPKNASDRRFMAMPAYLGGKFDMVGMKWYGSNVDNKNQGLPRSVLMMMLNDKTTGLPISLMSANLLSAYRTGAMPGVGVKYLAKKDSSVLGLVGPGVMGRTAAKSILCACPGIKEVKVKGRGQKSLDEFVEFVKEEFPYVEDIEIVDSIEKAVRSSDIICVSTSSPVEVKDYPFIEGEWVKPGALFCLPATVNFNDDFICRCRKVVDNMQLYDAWAEEYPYPTFGPITIIGSKFTDMEHEGKIKKTDIVDLGAVINGTQTGRTSEDEIILYSIGGMPVEDVAWGKIVYENAVDKGIGTKLNLWNIPALA